MPASTLAKRSLRSRLRLASRVTERSAKVVAPFLILTTVITVALIAFLLLGFRGGAHVESDDTNGDGRPDVWRTYDAHGALKHVAIDSNFDGRPDREEEYVNGALVRRESDRNFDQHVDLIEDFSPTTHERIRSVVDVNYDGVADLLVLFRDGLPIYSERASPGDVRRTASSANRHGGGLIPLADPFSRIPALRARSAQYGSAPAGTTAATLARDDTGAGAPVRALIRAPFILMFDRGVPRTIAPRGPPISLS